jgi:CMP-N,N'-diacetyllegionaminic acid synthase
MNTHAILIARGGSKGIPGKNIIDFCGKPLLAWTIEHCAAAHGVDAVWVSSDSKEIQNVGEAYGARTIDRPEALAGDDVTSEAAWSHALDVVEETVGETDLVLAPQVTSPLREAADIERGLELMAERQYDSMFSCSPAEDLYFWQHSSEGRLQSINYDWKNRKRRQDHMPQYIENGSFYLFRPHVLRQFKNRFGEHIGMVEMEFWKSFEIDSLETLRLCAALMREFLLNEAVGEGQ